MRTVTLIEGDGIGPEIALAVVEILEAAQAPLNFERVPIVNGELNEAVFESIEKDRLILKGPGQTPIGFGHRSLNVQLRKQYQLYANVLPVLSLGAIKSRYENVNLVIFRENTEVLQLNGKFCTQHATISIFSNNWQLCLFWVHDVPHTDSPEFSWAEVRLEPHPLVVHHHVFALARSFHFF